MACIWSWTKYFERRLGEGVTFKNAQPEIHEVFIQLKQYRMLAELTMTQNFLKRCIVPELWDNIDEAGGTERKQTLETKPAEQYGKTQLHLY